MSIWDPPRPPPLGSSAVMRSRRRRVAQRRFLKLPIWVWVSGVVGLVVLGAALPDPDAGTTVQSESVGDQGTEGAARGASSVPAPTPAVADTASTSPAARAATSVTSPASLAPAPIASNAPIASIAPIAVTPETMPAPTTIAGSVRALDVLAYVAVENEHQDGYDRVLFGYPGDLDGDGCDTRDEVLARDSSSPARVGGDGCTVVAGDWYSAVDDTTWSDPGHVQVDHLVALKEAWDSGAWAWDADRQQHFGNDLADRRTLRVMSTAANQGKGQADPSNWIPPNEAAVCGYVADWVAIKVRWTLSMDQSEFGRIRNLLTDRCPDQLIEPWPATPPPAPTTAPPTTVAVTIPALQPFIPSVPAVPTGDCDPSYPGVCIPSGPPDLDCGDIPDRRFTVVGLDPHGFDGDDDGVGCESG